MARQTVTDHPCLQCHAFGGGAGSGAHPVCRIAAEDRSGEVGGKLYVPTSLILGPDDPNERSWVQYVVANPEVRLRIDGTIYELRAERVSGDELANARAALLAKYEEDVDDHSSQAWIFRLEPR